MSAVADQVIAKTSDDESVAGRDRKKSGSRIRLGLVVVVACLAIAAVSRFGWHYWTVGRFLVETDDAYVKADFTTIAPKVPGYLTTVAVSDNEHVKAGQVLAQIDTRDYAAILDQAKATTDAAHAKTTAILASIAQQEAQVDEARATLAIDQSAIEFAQQEYDRYTKLASRGAGSLQLAQQATSQIASARATLIRDKAKVDAAQRQVAYLQASLTEAKANALQAEAAQRKAQLDVDDTTIRAPIDGVIGNRTLRIGQYVEAGTQLMAVVPLQDAYIVANFKETQLTDVRIGQPVEIEVDTYPDLVIRGHVDSLAPASGQEFALLPPDNATGNFTKIVQRIPVKIVIDPDDKAHELIRPGMSVVPVIDTKGGAASDLAVATAAPRS